MVGDVSAANGISVVQNRAQAVAPEEAKGNVSLVSRMFISLRHFDTF